MKILVTGAAGYIGREVVEEALRCGHSVIAMIRSAGTWARNDDVALEVLQADLRAPEQLRLAGRNIDAVVHLAATVTAADGKCFPDTVAGTRNLLVAMRLAGIRRLVGISSMAVLDYAAAAPMSVIDEDLAVVPSTKCIGSYAGAKRDQELLMEQAAHDGLSCVILRPGLVYDSRALHPAHAGIVRGKFGVLVMHAGEVPVVELGDLADAIIKAVEHECSGCETFNVIGDQLPDQARYISALARRGALPRRVIRVPWWLMRRCLGVGRFLFGLGGKTRAVPEILLPQAFGARLTPFRFSNARARRLLGWTPVAHFQ